MPFQLIRSGSRRWQQCTRRREKERSLRHRQRRAPWHRYLVPSTRSVRGPYRRDSAGAREIARVPSTVPSRARTVTSLTHSSPCAKRTPLATRHGRTEPSRHLCRKKPKNESIKAETTRSRCQKRERKKKKKKERTKKTREGTTCEAVAAAATSSPRDPNETDKKTRDAYSS